MTKKLNDVFACADNGKVCKMIIIKDMQLPRQCNECRFSSLDNMGCRYCKAILRHPEVPNGNNDKHQECPLTAVSELSAKELITLGECPNQMDFAKGEE